MSDEEQERPYPQPRTELITEALQRISESTGNLPMNPEEVIMTATLLIQSVVDICDGEERPYPGAIDMPCNCGHMIVLRVVDKKAVSKAKQDTKLRQAGIIVPPKNFEI